MIWMMLVCKCIAITQHESRHAALQGVPVPRTLPCAEPFFGGLVNCSPAGVVPAQLVQPLMHPSIYIGLSLSLSLPLPLCLSFQIRYIYICVCGRYVYSCMHTQTHFCI